MWDCGKLYARRVSFVTLRAWPNFCGEPRIGNDTHAVVTAQTWVNGVPIVTVPHPSLNPRRNTKPNAEPEPTQAKQTVEVKVK